ncbi:Uncharacterised protein [Mycobacteroides abscessus subsp. abscessus]|nr:Uncharacterised protein [Mycobacteroides abscessus subsp. abscessus]
MAPNQTPPMPFQTQKIRPMATPSTAVTTMSTTRQPRWARGAVRSSVSVTSGVAPEVAPEVEELLVVVTMCAPFELGTGACRLST